VSSATIERQAIVDRLLADPPIVHIVDTPEGKAPGVWSTEESCYRFIAEVAQPDMCTLETGSGISTALFAAVGCQHRCVTPAAVEAEHLRSYFDRVGISGDQVTFDVAPSHVALPRLTEPLDMALIDGGHGYPMPILDWFYAGGLLRRGGVLIVDDLPLPAVRALLEFLRADSRWASLEDTGKWAAFRRLSAGGLAEGQWDQLFYAPSAPRPLLRRVAGRARRELRHLGRAA
jgi:hypothetical protein